MRAGASCALGPIAAMSEPSQRAGVLHAAAATRADLGRPEEPAPENFAETPPQPLRDAVEIEPPAKTMLSAQQKRDEWSALLRSEGKICVRSAYSSP
jgi:hypothetical protein